MSAAQEIPTGQAAIEALARAFARRLREEIGEDDLRAVVARNRASGDPNGCASHDFCDANMPMAEAFEEVLGADPEEPDDCDPALWDAAWDRAKAADFWLDPVTTPADDMRALAERFEALAHHLTLRANVLRGAAEIGAPFHDATRARLTTLATEVGEALAKDEPVKP